MPSPSVVTGGAAGSCAAIWLVEQRLPSDTGPGSRRYRQTCRYVNACDVRTAAPAALREWGALPMERPRPPGHRGGSGLDGGPAFGSDRRPGTRMKDDARRRRCHPPKGQLQGPRAHPGEAVGPSRTRARVRSAGVPLRLEEEAISDMSGRDPDLPALQRELAEIAAGTTTLQQRAQAVLERLGHILPLDAAWLAVRDPERRRHTPV